MIKRLFLTILFLIPGTMCVFAQDAMPQTPFQLGEKYWVENKPEEAKVQFEAALIRDNRNEKVYYYLGMIYEQLKNNQKAIEILRNGLLISRSMTHLFYYMIGNNYFLLNDFTLAEKNFTQAIGEDSLFALAYLNRANARMKLIQYKTAVDDYKTYLRLEPATPQRPQIERLIALLEGDLAAQADLLDSVLNSIKNASSDTKTEGAGTPEYKDTGTDTIDILD
jgi:tetratricopeptide (TPR) repeat protein